MASANAETSPFPSINVSTATEMSSRVALRAIEFFSGIGGYHAATQVAALPIKVVAAYDINTDANRVYNYNFGQTPTHSASHSVRGHHNTSGSGDLAVTSPHKQQHTASWPISAEHITEVRPSTYRPAATTREYSTAFSGIKASTESIENLSLAKLDGTSDIWMMSPPCQPFTRAGARRDHTDNRTRPFLHLLDTLRRMLNPPSFLILENVKGFETSVSHERLLETLKLKDYTVSEFILTPTQFGLPNERVRYYCVATRNTAQQKKQSPNVDLAEMLNMASVSSEQPSQPSASQILTHIPGSPFFSPLQQAFQPKHLSEFLDGSANETDELKVPASYTSHRSYRFDMVTPQHTTSSCFTKAYAKNYRGSGPLILLGGQHIPSDPDQPLDASETTTGSIKAKTFPQAVSFNKSGETSEDDETALEELSVLQGPAESLPRYSIYRDQQLRFFSPQETLRLMGFPSWFNFPSELPTKQTYPLLGNSLNVLVVSELLKFMLRKHE